jgi:hypothetical protein
MYLITLEAKNVSIGKVTYSVKTLSVKTRHVSTKFYCLKKIENKKLEKFFFSQLSNIKLKDVITHLKDLLYKGGGG